LLKANYVRSSGGKEEEKESSRQPMFLSQREKEVLKLQTPKCGLNKSSDSNLCD